MNSVTQDIDKATQDFINNNNLFVEKGDPFEDFIISNIEGIHTFGKPNANVKVKKIKTDSALMYPGKTVFEANYTFDSIGRRNTEGNNSNSSIASIFFGDSQMFGEGVNDNETLAYYYQCLTKPSNSYNYGFLGHGPAQMLYTVSTNKFKDEFKNKSGKVFFLYRDDAIKTSVGEIPWGEGYPKYGFVNGELKYLGTYGGPNYSPNSMYLPSMYSEDDYNLTVEIFKKVKKELPNNFELIIVGIPLTFSNYRMQELLEDTEIRFFNFYHFDLEYHTGTKARFLDGVHTKYSNQVLAKRLFYYINNNIGNHNTPLTYYNTEREVYERLDLESIFIPVMVDFPEDDAGVIVSNIIKRSNPAIKLNSFDLLQYLKKKYVEKFNLLSHNTPVRYIDSLKLKEHKDIAKFEYITIQEEINKISYE